MDMAISNIKKVGKSQENFAVIRYSPAIKVAIKKKKYKNPMAFLKRGDDLILGNGEIHIGDFFVNDAAIDFDRVKYKFTAVECVDEKNKWMGIDFPSLLNKV
jgi:hypothetical protein